MEACVQRETVRERGGISMVTVLVIDRLAGRRSLIEQALTRDTDDVVISAGSVEKGMGALREYSPDVTILDLGLADDHGAAALAGLLAENPDAVILVLGIPGDRDSELDALREGASAAIAQPIDPGELVKLVHSAAQGERAEAEVVSAPEPTPVAKPVNTGPARVLIADPDTKSRQLLRRMMVSYRHEVVEDTPNCRRVVELYRQHQPDVVLVDCFADSGDRGRCLAELREADPAVAMIVVTSVKDTHAVQNAVRAGVQGYVLKPVDSHLLVKTINQAVKARRDPAAAAAAGPAAPAAPPRYRMVVIEHQMPLRRMLQKVASLSDCAISAEVTDADEAVQRVLAEDPDLVLIDLELPGGSPVEIIVALHRGLPDLPVIALSASADRQLVKSVMEHGAAGFVLKPFDPVHLAKQIRTQLATRRSD